MLNELHSKTEKNNDTHQQEKTAYSALIFMQQSSVILWHDPFQL